MSLKYELSSETLHISAKERLTPLWPGGELRCRAIWVTVKKSWHTPPTPTPWPRSRPPAEFFGSSPVLQKVMIVSSTWWKSKTNEVVPFSLGSTSASSSFIISLTPSVEWCTNSWAINTSPPRNHCTVVHRVSSSLSGPVVPSFRALSGRLKFTVRRDESNEYFLARQHHRDGAPLTLQIKRLHGTLLNRNRIHFFILQCFPSNEIAWYSGSCPYGCDEWKFIEPTNPESILQWKCHARTLTSGELPWPFERTLNLKHKTTMPTPAETLNPLPPRLTQNSKPETRNLKTQTRNPNPKPKVYPKPESQTQIQNSKPKNPNQNPKVGSKRGLRGVHGHHARRDGDLRGTTQRPANLKSRFWKHVSWAILSKSWQELGNGSSNGFGITLEGSLWNSNWHITLNPKLYTNEWFRGITRAEIDTPEVPPYTLSYLSFM